MTRSWKLFAIGVTLLVPALVGSAAFAQGYPSGQPTASCSPTSVAAGGSLTCSGGNWEPGTTVSVILLPGPQTLGTTTVHGDGTFSTTVTIPADTRPGSHVVHIKGLSLKNGTPFTVSVHITVLGSNAAGGAGHGDSLAFTGANISAGVLILIGLLALGVGALAVSRRRSRSHATSR